MIIEVYWKSNKKQNYVWPTKLRGAVLNGERPAAIVLMGFTHQDERVAALKLAKDKVDQSNGYVGERP
jgi:hypothetical protein